MLSPTKTTRVNNAYDRLKSDILTGALPPGYQASEPDFASRLKMSRTPVREALIRLEAEGLVDLVPRRGARVFSVTTQDFLEIHQILSTLEGLAAAIVARRDLQGCEFDEMETVLEAAESALLEDDLEAFAVQDDLFHRLLAKLSTPRLHREIEQLLNQIYRANMVLVRLNKGPVAMPVNNRKLMEALRTGAADKAEAMAKCHRMEGMAKMKLLFESCGLTHL